MSGTSSRAPSPVQFTTAVPASAACPNPDTVRRSTVPPAAASRRSSHARWTGMSSSGNVTRSPSGTSTASPSPAAQPPSAASRSPPCSPATRRTPVSSGAAASSSYTASVSSDQPSTRSA